MMTLHLDYQGKSARVGLHYLPGEQPRATLRLTTSAGPIQSVRVRNGVRRFAPGELPTLEALRDGNPELDLDSAGGIIAPDEVTPAYFSPAAGLKPVTDFRDVDVIHDANGAEKERRAHLRRRPNLDDLHPVKVGKQLPLHTALTQMAFRQTLQVVHVDGLTFDFLAMIARDLAAAQALAAVGAGPKGNQPLVIRESGSPYRGFLYGEIDGSGAQARYKLLLLLSDQELKLPEARTEGAQA